MKREEWTLLYQRIGKAGDLHRRFCGAIGLFSSSEDDTGHFSLLEAPLRACLASGRREIPPVHQPQLHSHQRGRLRISYLHRQLHLTFENQKQKSEQLWVPITTRRWKSTTTPMIPQLPYHPKPTPITGTRNEYKGRNTGIALLSTLS